MNDPAADYARPDWISRLLHMRDARVDSPEMFGFLARLVIDEWHAGCPGVRSSAQQQAEMMRLGTIVQSSVVMPQPPSYVYHLEWMLDVLLDARRQVAIDEASNKGREAPSADDRAHAQEVIQLWGMVEIHGYKQREVASQAGCSASTVNRRVAKARSYIRPALVRAGRLRS